MRIGTGSHPGCSLAKHFFVFMQALLKDVRGIGKEGCGDCKMLMVAKALSILLL